MMSRQVYRYGLRDAATDYSEFLEVKSVKIQISCSRMSLKVVFVVEFVETERDLKEAVFILPVAFKSVLYALSIDIATRAGGNSSQTQKFSMNVFKLADAENRFNTKTNKTNQSVGLIRMLNERQDAILLRIGNIKAHSELKAHLNFGIQQSNPVSLNTFHFSIKTAYECFVGSDTAVEVANQSHLEDSNSAINQLVTSRTKIDLFELLATSSCGTNGPRIRPITHHMKQEGTPQLKDGGNTIQIKYSVHDPIKNASDGRFEVDYTIPELKDPNEHSNCIVFNENKNRSLYKKLTLHSIIWKHRMPVAYLYLVEK